jgi:hypothetical protein
MAICKVCIHEQKDAIENMYATGCSEQDIVDAHSELTKSSVHRHLTNHMSKIAIRDIIVRRNVDDTVARGLLDSEPENAREAIVSLLANMYATAEAIMSEAQMDENKPLALKAMAEARANLALAAKFTVKEVADIKQPRSNDDSLEDFVDMANALKNVLPRYPDCAQEILKELEIAGNFKLANAIMNGLSTYNVKYARDRDETD